MSSPGPPWPADARGWVNKRALVHFNTVRARRTGIIAFSCRRLWRASRERGRGLGGEGCPGLSTTATDGEAAPLGPSVVLPVLYIYCLACGGRGNERRRTLRTCDHVRNGSARPGGRSTICQTRSKFTKANKASSNYLVAPFPTCSSYPVSGREGRPKQASKGPCREAWTELEGLPGAHDVFLRGCWLGMSVFGRSRDPGMDADRASLVILSRKECFAFCPWVVVVASLVSCPS